tara:strand:- start:186 stop:341 length:156 start_codon:yes stop_codon:yes gene_type:complete
MIFLENKTKEEFELDPYNLKFREYQARRRQQIRNYLYRKRQIEKKLKILSV